RARVFRSPSVASRHTTTAKNLGPQDLPQPVGSTANAGLSALTAPAMNEPSDRKVLITRPELESGLGSGWRPRQEASVSALRICRWACTKRPPQWPQKGLKPPS